MAKKMKIDEMHTHPMMIRVSPRFLKMLDEWRRAQEDIPPRSEAVRRIVEERITGGRTDVDVAKPRRRKT